MDRAQRDRQSGHFAHLFDIALGYKTAIDSKQHMMKNCLAQSPGREENSMDTDAYINEAKELGRFLGQKIKEARVSAGMTQQQLSEKLGLAPVAAMVSQLEHGHRLPRDSRLQKVCEVLSLNYDELKDMRNRVKGLRKLARLVAGEQIPSLRSYAPQYERTSASEQSGSVYEMLAHLDPGYRRIVTDVVMQLTRLQDLERRPSSEQ